MLLCSLFWGSEPFCNFRLRSPESFPSTSIIPAFHICYSRDPRQPAPLLSPRCVMMLMMSHLCLSLVLYKKLYVVCLGLLYFCVKSWHNLKKKKHVKKGLDRTKALWEEGYAGSRAVGPSLMAITSLVPFVTVSSLVPFVTVSVLTVVVVSVLMLIFL